MAKRLHSDRWLFLLTILMVMFGLVMVFSASAVVSTEQTGSPYAFLKRQLAWAVAGVAAMLVVMRTDYRLYRRELVIFGSLSLTLLLLVLVLFGDPSHNTHRWFRIGSLSFQPSEMAKPVLILFIAWFLDMRLSSGRDPQQVVNDTRGTLLPLLSIVSVTVLLILIEPDLGTAVVVLLIGVGMLFAAGMRMRYFLYALAAAPALFYFLVWRVPYRRVRVEVFLDPFKDPQGKGFQMAQSLIAVGTGGLTGAGLMEGKQKLFYLPAPHTDFIFAVVAEELGLLGAGCLVLAFLVFLWRGLRAASRAPDVFGRLLAIGVTIMIVCQALINFSVVVGLLPTKGIPLPFISSGGSSLLFNLIAVGMLLNVSQHAD